MGLYDLSGRPLYLESVRGTVSDDLLSYLNHSLPDGEDVRNHHPAFLSGSAASNLVVTKTSDVWVTFVSEGAGNLNAIGYYTYPTATPPKTAADIDEIKYVLPNASMSGSGGSLRSGDRVKLGRFGAGTSIGFVLFASGWNSVLRTVSSGATKFYSDAAFNPEADVNLKKHTLLLSMPGENIFVMGFEDLNRTSSSCDHDFNDVLIYANSNPVDAISSTGVRELESPKDTDGDGVVDAVDKFPNDPARAYVNYYPSENGWGTLAFEDNWPSKGDYDMNDLVIKYRYAYVSNADNNVVEMQAKYGAVASYATYKNGFGVQFPFSPSIVKSVSGAKISGSYVSFSPNGTESGQSKAVIVPFDNHTQLIANNVVKDSVSMNIVFNAPVAVSTLGDAPFNPFLISDMHRGIEIHLSGTLPTDKADRSFLGTYDDRTSTSLGKYYLSAQNWPWALHFSETFAYPKEGKAINTAYLRFADWAGSGGVMYPDWYSNTAAGYRNTANIETR
jgi:LruC domain-containing protein